MELTANKKRCGDFAAAESDEIGGEKRDGKVAVCLGLPWLVVARRGSRARSRDGVADRFGGVAGAFDVGVEVDSEDVERVDGGGGVTFDFAIGDDGCFGGGYGVFGSGFGGVGSFDGKDGVCVVLGVIEVQLQSRQDFLQTPKLDKSAIFEEAGGVKGLAVALDALLDMVW